MSAENPEVSMQSPPAATGTRVVVIRRWFVTWNRWKSYAILALLSAVVGIGTVAVGIVTTCDSDYIFYDCDNEKKVYIIVGSCLIFLGVCITTDNELMHHGDQKEVECLPQTCMDRVLVPTYKVSTCDGPFVEHAVGCVHLLRENKTWCDARKYCASLGADLAVVQAEKFSSLQKFLNDIAAGSYVWVGAKERKWLDGRLVAQNEWSPNEPNGWLDQCEVMKWMSKLRNFLFHDVDCNTVHYFLCMRN